MDDAAREAAVDNLVRHSDAVRDSVEMVRQRRTGDRVTALARWTEARTARLRRGAVDVVMICETASDRGLVVEILDADGNLLHTTPLA